MAEIGSLDPVAARLGPGTRLNGIFEIDGRIASGGMGEIYRGHAIETGDPVAIKVMRTDLGDNAMALALFRKEASALHNIQHEAIVRYYLFSNDPATQRHYLAMEFVDGQPLSDILKKAPLSFESVRRLQQRLAAGLDAAHRYGIIHRDLSPDNVLIPEGDVGRAKIIDFGIARSTRAGAGTIIGSNFAGKYNYVSPEQLGLFGGDVTAKSDIYSLGLVLVECLTGKALDMSGNQVEVIDKRRLVPPLDGVDARYRPLLEKMLQPDPKDRPQSMAAVAEWEPPRAPVPRRATPRPSPARSAGAAPPRKSRLPALSALGALLLLAAIVGAYVITGIVIPPTDDTTPSAPDLNLGDGANSQRTDKEAGKLDAKERITGFVNAYDGGDCFFVTPTTVTENNSSLDGYSVSTSPLDLLDTEFKRRNGYEATIGFHQVTPPQCAALNFMRRMQSVRGPVPRLVISAERIQSGDDLSGAIAQFGDRHVDLLLVADDGNVDSLSDRLHAEGAAKTFSVALQRAASGPPRLPQLLIAIAAEEPPQTLQATQLGSADQLFPQLLAEAQHARQPVGVGFRYFMLEK